MNPIYRHSFVNAFLANGKISNTTGDINGNNTNFYYTRTFVPVRNVYPRKLFQNNTLQAGGAFYDSNKRVIGGWGGTAWLRLGTLDAPNVLQGQTVHPIYKDDLAKEYELETNQRFYRAKLSGKITFVRDAFDYINRQSFDNEFLYCIEKSDNGGRTWFQYFQGKFMKTDCTFTDYDKKVVVQPDVIDDYNDVLAGLEKEYNLITLAPTIQRITINKRPLIQIYVPGDSVVSCFLGGMNWEQDANATTDQNTLVQTYHFALCNILKEIRVTANGTPSDIAGLYTGRMATDSSTDTFSGNLFPANNDLYYIHITQKGIGGVPVGVAMVDIRRRSDDVVLFVYVKATTSPFDTLEFDFVPANGSSATGTMHADMKSYNK